MEGLFSFLGCFGSKEKLLTDNQETTDLIRFFLPYAPEKLSPNNSLTGFIGSVIDVCNSYFTYSPKPESDNLALFQNGVMIWEQLAAYFKIFIQENINIDLAYILAASWRYSLSLEMSPKIINGTKRTPSYYIKIFDGIKKSGKGRGEIRKLLENSGGWFNKDSYGFPANMALTPLPQFIRRYYDMGISFDGRGKPVLPSEDEIKTPVMNSIFDIAPVLGLLGVSTPRKNPYIQKESFTASINSFVKSFISAPLNTNKSQEGMLSAEEILSMVLSVAVSDGESQETINFLNSISPEELVLFNQFVIERLTHAMFLEKALNKPDNSNAFSSYLYHGYTYPLMLELISLPLLNTRISIIDAIQNKDFINDMARRAYQVTKDNITEEMRLAVMAIFTDIVSIYVKYWRDVVIPIHILAFHYFSRKSCLTISPKELKCFFSNYLNMYRFYTYNEDGDVSLNLPNPATDNDKRNERAKAFYNKFNEETSKQARENRLYNTVQKTIEIKQRTHVLMAQAYREIKKEDTN